jgi:hypothetical protein
VAACGGRGGLRDRCGGGGRSGGARREARDGGLGAEAAGGAEGGVRREARGGRRATD